MKFMKPSYEVFDLPDADSGNKLLMHLEKIGRICYKSEDRITSTSASNFLKNIKERKHWAMLEHYIFTFSVTKDIYCDITDGSLLDRYPYDYELNHHMKYIYATYWPEATKSDMKYLVSASATTLNYLWESKAFQHDNTHGIVKLCDFLTIAYPEIMKNAWNNEVYAWPGIRLLSRAEIESLPPELRMIHDFMSVKFITSRASSHDIVRHRPSSWAMESTRYVNYSRRFGVQYIIPAWFSETDRQHLLNEKDVELLVQNPEWMEAITFLDNHDDVLKFVRDCHHAEIAYLDFIEHNNYIPEQAMHILPHALKTELVMTARLMEWRHFFKMRADSHARAEIREFVIPLFREQINQKPEIFADMRWVSSEI